MPNKPLLSIITVNLNNLEGLKRTMNSVFNQTWQEYEYIIIDGGSTDGSKELIEQDKEKISYWVSESDKGIYNAMNKGILEANGDYLLFLNSGDHFYKPDSLENFCTIQNPDDVICFDCLNSKENKDFVKTGPDEIRFSFFIKDSLNHQATFIKRDLFSKYGLYSEELEISSDWKFFLDVLCKFNCSYKKVPKTLSVHYHNGLSHIPENWEKIISERKKVLQSDYHRFLEDTYNAIESKAIVGNLKKSRKINLMIRLGLIQPF